MPLEVGTLELAVSLDRGRDRGFDWEFDWGPDQGFDWERDWGFDWGSGREVIGLLWTTDFVSHPTCRRWWSLLPRSCLHGDCRIRSTPGTPLIRPKFNYD